MADPVSAGIILAVNLAAQFAVRQLVKPKPRRLERVGGNVQGEGAGLAVCYGSEAVVDGTYLSADFDRTQVGARPEKAHYNGVVGLCDTTMGQIYQILRVYAGDKFVFFANQSVEYTNISSSLTVVERDWGVREVMVIRSVDDAVDLSDFRSGADVVVAGWTNANNNGTFRCIRATKGTTTSAVWLDNPAAVGGDTPGGGGVDLTQDIPPFTDKDFRDFQELTGTNTAPVPTVLENIYGTGEVETFRGVAGFVANRMRLAPHGNLLPPIRGVVQTDSIDVTLAAVVEGLLDRVEKEYVDRGYNLSISRDTTGLQSTIVRGETFRAPFKVLDAFQQLAIVHNMAVQDRGSQLAFFTRDNAPEVAIDTDYLAAHGFGFDPEWARQLSGRGETRERVPSEIHLRHYDPEKNYEIGTQKAVRDGSDEPNVKTVDVASTLTADEAKAVAERLLWMARANGQATRLSLPMRYVHVQENDVLTFTDEASHSWRLLVDRVDRRHDNFLEVEAVEEVANPLTATRSGVSTESEEAEPYVPPEIEIAAWECGPLEAEDVDTPVLYYAVSNLEDDDDFPGADIYLSRDGTNFDQIDYVTVPATMGFSVGTALPAPTKFGYWDESSTFKVVFTQGEPETATRAEVLRARKNWCMLGGELLAYRDYVDNGDGTHTLSGLLRGLNNTESEAAAHTQGEHFIVLARQYHRIELSPSDVGVTIYLKAVADGEEITDVDNVISRTFTGETVKPWPVANIRGYRGDARLFAPGILIDWVRRSREPGTIFGSRGLIEPVEKYQIEVLDSAGAGGGAVVNTYTVTNRSYFTYSSSKQSSDGLTPGYPVDVRISQWSEALQAYGDSKEGTAN